MGRERRPYTRTSEVRDARLFAIVTEGQKTEYEYFLGLREHLDGEPTRIHVKVLEREESNSSPKYIIGLMDEFVEKHQLTLDDDDELWLVIDRDAQSWGEGQISEVAQECFQKGYSLALSNPCFELWLLLHWRDVDSYYSTEEKEELFLNKKISSSRTVLKREVGLVMTGYNPSNPDMGKLLPFIKDAVERARALDINPAHRWPLSLGTRVYLLVEKLLVYAKS
ncbi:RloB family protein [Hymenobacter properus]|uniref:RloB domain-containing protein n=1 Tax=Hymenobacter properus TaxID=2791026 RepID=A0A931FNJ1_9BACT|nr:RloB family protein [Hymenobacter properus]MBF9142694.1 RloB domain-containing protein [Hymenobacter properus]MBR7721502.1 RloB domain-containing protein [Microvirga sp. SRT04]